MKLLKSLFLLSALVTIAGCSLTGTQRAPVVDGSAATVYTVESGDTLYSIARKYALDPAQVARDNRITDPTTLQVGQRLSLYMAKKSNEVVVAPTVTPTAPAAKQVAAASEAPAKSTVMKAPEVKTSQSPGLFGRPVQGAVTSGFGPTNKGVDLSAKEGEKVRAAADGKVIYVGTMRGYGNLVIVQHDDGYVTAYGHNKQVTAKNEEQVKRGDAIAVAGSTAERPKPTIHFEIRRKGLPIDPVTLF